MNIPGPQNGPGIFFVLSKLKINNINYLIISIQYAINMLKY